jgi:hypothetical protein
MALSVGGTSQRDSPGSPALLVDWVVMVEWREVINGLCMKRIRWYCVLACMAI